MDRITLFFYVTQICFQICAFITYINYREMINADCIMNISFGLLNVASIYLIIHMNEYNERWRRFFHICSYSGYAFMLLRCKQLMLSMQFSGKLCFLIPTFYAALALVYYSHLALDKIMRECKYQTFMFNRWKYLRALEQHNDLLWRTRMKRVKEEKKACLQVAVRCGIPMHLMKIIYDGRFDDIS